MLPWSTFWGGGEQVRQNVPMVRCQGVAGMLPWSDFRGLGGIQACSKGQMLRGVQTCTNPVGKGWGWGGAGMLLW